MNVEALRVLFNSPCGSEKWMVKQLVLNLVFHLLLIKIQITSFHYLTPLILVKIESFLLYNHSIKETPTP
jgi:hypothetical protein